MLKMVANFTRIDTLELKELIFRKTGHERAERYFYQLKRFLSLKLSKAEFNRSCIQTLGRENISLHNKLILSIVQNANAARTPPRKVEGLNVKVTNGYQRNCLQSLYGDAFPQSPRKCRSPVSRDRKFRDRPSPLGPLGKSPSITCEETVTRTQEQQSATDLQSLCSRPPIEDGEEVEQYAGSLSMRRWSPITAPLGVSVHGVGTHNAGRCGYKDDTCAETCENRGELPDTISLRSRLQKKLAMEGVGISLECADVINKSLDVFLKKIIEPCVSISSSKRRDPHNLGSQSSKAAMSELNRILPARFAERSASQSTNVSMLDFRVAMESNPCLLGADWPIQLEKICHYASQE